MLTTLLGKKVGMTQVFDEGNTLVPVTVIQAGPCPVVQVKTVESDGYNAIQIGYGERKAKNVSKALQGHLKKHQAPLCRTLREVRCPEAPAQKVGDLLTVSEFQAGEKIDIIGITKGRGFQGVVKRFRFAGGPASHGSMFHRRGGSYGMCQWPGHTIKGKKMPGHMGQVTRTVQNLRVIRVDEERNLILVKGSIPGANGDEIMVRKAKKAHLRALSKAS